MITRRPARASLILASLAAMLAGPHAAAQAAEPAVPRGQVRYTEVWNPATGENYGSRGVAQPAAEPAPTDKPAKKARAPIYDEAADAGAQISAALAKAKKENRRVLIQWGANWCGWCHILHDGFKQDKKVAKTLQYEYDLVLIDIGKFDKNMDLAEKYGAKLKASGVPYLTILDPDANVLGNFETGNLEWPQDSGKQSGHDPDKVHAILSKHAAAPLKAEALFASAVEAAKKTNKKVFLHFGAPWCGWCHKLEDWMAKPQIAAILAKDFVDLKIDTERMDGGARIFENYKPESTKAGIPWFVFIDPVAAGGTGGGAIITSDATPPTGNTGFPAAKEEVAHFKAMLLKAKTSMSDADVQILVDSLTAAGENR